MKAFFSVFALIITEGFTVVCKNLHCCIDCKLPVRKKRVFLDHQFLFLEKYILHKTGDFSQKEAASVACFAFDSMFSSQLDNPLTLVCALDKEVRV